MRRAWALLPALAAGCAMDGGPPPPPRVPPRAETVPRTAPPALAAPAWRPAPVVADAPPRPERATSVLPGEGLAQVARRENVSPGALAAANRLTPPYALLPGQRLAIPGGRWHVVKRGETLSAIARAYRASLGPVARANGLADPYPLEIGDIVLIPAAPRLTLEQRARANRLDIDRLIAGLPPANAQRPGEGRARPVNPLPPGERVAAKPSGEGRTAAQPTPAAPALASAPQFDWPLPGRILSGFGRKPGGRVNDGVNIAAVAGAPVKAAADGQVIYAGTGVPAFGGLVLLRHAGGWITAYGHNETLAVARGEQVTRGQTIARAGATGEVDEPQLHFEVRRGRVPVNPLPLLPARAS